MPQPVNPLHLFMTADAVGGVFQYAVDLAAGLTNHGVRTTLAMLGPPMSRSHTAMAQQVPGLTVLETGLALDWLADDAATVRAAAREVASLSERHGADLVQVNAPALAAADFSVPVVAAAHSCLASWWACVKRSALPPDFIWRTRMMAEGLRRADVVVCPSDAFGYLLREIYGCEPLVVHNGRSASALIASPSVVPTAFTAGRLWDEGKNIGVLDAAARWTSVPFEAAGPLEGPNGASQTLRHLTSAGVLDETRMRQRLARRPIFVSSALYEPFGLTVLEAAQAGCPLVLSDIPTFRELWTGAAVFVPARAPRVFAEAINALAADPGHRTRLGAAAAARARRYGREAMASRMAELYRTLLAAPAAQTAEAAE